MNDKEKFLLGAGVLGLGCPHVPSVGASTFG
jgi:hypothetical protein